MEDFSENTSTTSTQNQNQAGPILSATEGELKTSKVPLKRMIYGVLIAVLIVGLAGSVSIFGYYLGQRSKDITPTVSPLPAETVTEPQFVNTSSGRRFEILSIPNWRELQVSNFSSSGSEASVEVFVFADVTEAGYSGTVLSQTVPYLLQEFPEKVRVWYVHSPLNYRDMAEQKIWVTQLDCLAEQGKVWENMTAMVDQIKEEQYSENYSLSDQTQYENCTAQLKENPESLDIEIQAAQQRMVTFNVPLIPTMLFVSPQTNKIVKLAGVVPLYQLKQDMGDIFKVLDSP